MIVGYARTSTAEQIAGLEAQVRVLTAAGVGKMFSEQVSSVAQRPQLQACLTFLREGDRLVVTKPDRLARSTADLLRIIEDLDRRKVALTILSMGGETLDTRSPTAKLLLTMLGAVAEFERNLMLERQREGIRKAQAENRYNGRPKTINDDAIRAMSAEGKTPKQIAKTLGIHRASVYRALKPAAAPALAVAA